MRAQGQKVPVEKAPPKPKSEGERLRMNPGGAVQPSRKAAVVADPVAGPAPRELSDSEHGSPMRIPKKSKASHSVDPPATSAIKALSAGSTAVPQMRSLALAPVQPLAGSKRKLDSVRSDSKPAAKLRPEETAQRGGGSTGRRSVQPFVYGVRFPPGDPATDRRFINSRHEMNRLYRKTAEEEGSLLPAPAAAGLFGDPGSSEAGEGAYMHARWSGDVDDDEDAAAVDDGGIVGDVDERQAALRRRLGWLHPQLLDALPSHLLFQSVCAPPRHSIAAEVPMGRDLSDAVARADASGAEIVVGSATSYLGVAPAALSRRFPGLQVARDKREARERRVLVLAAAKRAILSDRAEQTEKRDARTHARNSNLGGQSEVTTPLDVSNGPDGVSAAASVVDLEVSAEPEQPSQARPAVVDSPGVSAERAAALLAMLH